MNVDDLAVLAIPAVLVTGLVLLGLGLDGRTRDARRSRRWVGRFQDWATQAGVRGVRPWHVVAVCGGSGLAAGLAMLALTRSGSAPRNVESASQLCGPVSLPRDTAAQQPPAAVPVAIDGCCCDARLADRPDS